MQIIDCKGFIIGRFKIPPFTLNKGELINLKIHGGGHFWHLHEKLVDIFTGVIEQENVRINAKLEFAEHIQQSRFKRMFFPLTVEKYLKKYSQPTDMPLSIFPDDGLTPKKPISLLAGNLRRFLSIYAALSRCDGLVFDLVGLGPLGAEKIFEIVKNHVESKNGYAIHINSFDDFQEESTKSIVVELLDS